MAANKRYKFILCDASVNCYGFRVLPEGIDLVAYKKNPVVLWMHERSDDEQEVPRMPVGKCVELALEDGMLVGYVEFDQEDELAVKVEKKVAGGFLNACSIGFDWLEISEEPEQMLPGQIRPTVTKSMLSEWSIVDIPGNRNAIKMRDPKGALVKLHSIADRNKLDATLPIISTINQTSMKELLLKFAILLGLASDASEQQILDAVSKLKNDNTELVKLKKELEDKALADKATTIKTLVDGAKKDGKITEEEVPHYTKLAGLDFDSTKSILDSKKTIAKPDKLSSLLRDGKVQSAAAGTAYKTEFDRLRKEDAKELERLQKQEPDVYAQLEAEYRASKSSKG